MSGLEDVPEAVRVTRLPWIEAVQIRLAKGTSSLMTQCPSGPIEQSSSKQDLQSTSSVEGWSRFWPDS